MKKLLSTLLFLFVVAILSLSAQTDIYPPTLLEPEDADDGQMPNVTLDWAAVGGSGGVVEYEVQIDVTDAFTSATTFPKTELSGLTMEYLDFGQLYYWRVRAWEGIEVSDWSGAFSFTVFETIELSKPNDGNDEQDVNVELKAKDRIGTNDITGINLYDFQADTSANFDSDLLFEGTSETAVLRAHFLHFGETYYWHARVMHTMDTCVWSEMRTFEVWIAPELDKPNNNSSDMGLEVILSWDELPGVLDYTIQVADNDAFTNPLTAISEGLEFTTGGYLTFGGEYFWRVRANHATDTSAWSEVRNFTTASTVTLTSPEDGELDVSINPILEWDEISGIDFFHVQFNTSNNFDDPCCDEMIEGTENFFQVIYILDKGTTYYWHCRAINGIDTTAYSDVWSFTTEEEIGIGETAFDQSNINIYPNPSNGKLYIDIAGEENVEVSIRIMDMLGQIHVEENVMFGQGNSSRLFDLNDFANGLYIVKLTRGDQNYSHKITVHK